MTPNDKELIELAKRSIGLTSDRQFMKDNGGRVFNSLTSDSDAHSLMVELEIDLLWRQDGVVAKLRDNHHIFVVELHNNTLESKRAALRRAVTRVAAKIGRNKS